MSYSLAYAFYLVQKWMPTDFLEKLVGKKEWSASHLGEEKFKRLRSVLIEQCDNEMDTFKQLKEEWT